MRNRVVPLVALIVLIAFSLREYQPLLQHGLKNWRW